MGMPVITPGGTTREQAVTDIIESVALQESAFSHIINAESEKMQTIIDMEGTTTEQLLRLNSSVRSMLNALTRTELLLQSKLDIISSPCTGTCMIEVMNERRNV